MSYGTGPLGFTPLGLPAGGPLTLTRAPLTSSRKIDGVTKRYVTTAAGGFEGMDDVAQRVLLLLSFADTEIGVITPQTMRAQEQKFRDALAPLTNQRAPTIKILEVSVRNPNMGRLVKTIRYKNLLTNTEQTAPLQ